jgi:hypothetical protein
LNAPCLVGSPDTRNTGGKIRYYKVYAGRPETAIYCTIGLRIGDIPQHEVNPLQGLHWKYIDCNHPATRGDLLYSKLGPTTGRCPQIQNHVTWVEKMITLIDLLKFVGGPGSVSFPVRLAYIPVPSVAL